MQSSTTRLAAALTLTLLACGGTPASTVCRIDGECVSGRCGSDGVCVPVGGTDASTSVDGATSSDGGEFVDGGDAGAERDGGVLRDGGTGTCLPNQDGRIDFSELPFAAGRSARYRISTDVDPFTSAPACAGADCGWNYVDVGGQTVETIVSTLAVDGMWFMTEPAFSTATYAVASGDFEIPFVCTQRQLAVYRHDPQGLWLLGIVSEREDGGTLLVNDPPVLFLKYPLQEGATWSVDTTARGPLCNSFVDYAIDQTWTGTVDEVGYFVTPFGRFEQVLRVNTHFERHIGVGVTPTESRTHTFVAECFTTVGAVVSNDGESAAEISPAREVRRIAPF